MEMNRYIDHTYLKAFGSKEDIDTLISEAKDYHFKSVCINPTHVAYAHEALKDSDVLVCTVIGFPLGANTVETKVFETLNAVKNGADEIDMVINIGKFKDKDYQYIKDEINEVCRAAGDKLVKVIVEICYLDNEEIKKVSQIVGETDAEFIKTSTGFGTSGASVEAVKIMKEHVNGKEVKAAGGVRSKEDLQAMVDAGATRIGASSGVKIMKGLEGSDY